MTNQDLVLDINLYLCERFGYKDCCGIMQNENGFCLCVRESDVKMYVRFWEYSGGVNGFPDWCIIIVDCQFANEQDKNLLDFVDFLKEYAPRYGYRFIGVESDEQDRYHQRIGLFPTTCKPYCTHFVGRL